jgi:hypothetical protein
LEALFLSGNDFGGVSSSSDLLSILSGLLGFFQTLRTFHLSDCKIILDELDSSSFDENCWKRLLNTIKISSLTNVDLSYNQFSSKYFSGLIESLPDYQVESLNLSNSLIKKRPYSRNNNANCAERQDDFIDSFTKFIGSNLTSLALRGLGLTFEQTTILIE